MESPRLEIHPLVQKGKVTADELFQYYHIAMAAVSTLLEAQASEFREQVVASFCKRLKLRNRGSGLGQPLQATLNGLMLRLLPGIIANLKTTNKDEK